MLADNGWLRVTWRLLKLFPIDEKKRDQPDDAVNDVDRQEQEPRKPKLQARRASREQHRDPTVA